MVKGTIVRCKEETMFFTVGKEYRVKEVSGGIMIEVENDIGGSSYFYENKLMENFEVISVPEIPPQGARMPPTRRSTPPSRPRQEVGSEMPRQGRAQAILERPSTDSYGYVDGDKRMRWLEEQGHSSFDEKSFMASYPKGPFDGKELYEKIAKFLDEKVADNPVEEASWGEWLKVIRELILKLRGMEFHALIVRQQALFDLDNRNRKEEEKT